MTGSKRRIWAASAAALALGGCCHARHHAAGACRGAGPDDVMVRVGSLCVDRYEASIWSDARGTGTAYGVGPGQTPYPAAFPPSGNATASLYAVSKAGALPSTRVTWFQAQQACAASGKRLLTNAEWQMAAAGTPDGGTEAASAPCNIFGTGLVPAGARPACLSRWQVNDMVGNAWEWTADWTQGLSEGPAGQVNTPEYGGDWVYHLGAGGNGGGPEGTVFPPAIIRGGGWQSGKLGGIFTIWGDVQPSASIIGPSDGDMGFRCGR